MQLLRFSGTTKLLGSSRVRTASLPTSSLPAPSRPLGHTSVAERSRERSRANARTLSPVVPRASSSSSSYGTGTTFTPPSQDPAFKAQQLTELLQETVRVTIQTGPKGLFRGLQAADAVLSLTREYVARGSLDPPEVVLRKLFERLGSTYIKLGQFIASSPSLFPDEYVLEFQKCLDSTDAVPFAQIRGTIESELKRPLSDVFSYIEEVPLATASVAQVHAAVLRDSRKEVVIKVLKPGVEDILTTDMAYVHLFSRFLEFIQPELERLSLTAIIGDVRTSMMEEVDLVKEAEHIQEFSTFLDSSGFRDQATCPFVYKQFSTKRVMVMERLRGAPLVDYSAIRGVTQKDPETVLVSALNTWFASVVGAATFHADVHAGNLLVLPDGRVGFLDFGIVGRISPVTWRAVEMLLQSLATADYETMARALATIGACRENVNYEAFGRDLEAFFVELEQINTNVIITNDRLNGAGNASVSAALEVDQTQLNRLFLNLVRIGEIHGVKFPREFGLFLKQLLYFDRYTRILAPQLQVLSDERIRTTDLSSQYGRRF